MEWVSTMGVGSSWTGAGVRGGGITLLGKVGVKGVGLKEGLPPGPSR